MCQAIEGLGGLLIAIGTLIPLYDKGTSWDFLILFTFFSFVPKSGKRISMLSICRDKDLAHQDLWRPAPYEVAFVVRTVDGSSSWGAEVVDGTELGILW